MNAQGRTIGEELNFFSNAPFDGDRSLPPDWHVGTLHDSQQFRCEADFCSRSGMMVWVEMEERRLNKGRARTIQGIRMYCRVA